MSFLYYCGLAETLFEYGVKIGSCLGHQLIYLVFGQSQTRPKLLQSIFIKFWYRLPLRTFIFILLQVLNNLLPGFQIDHVRTYRNVSLPVYRDEYLISNLAISIQNMHENCLAHKATNSTESIRKACFFRSFCCPVNQALNVKNIKDHKGDNEKRE